MALYRQIEQRYREKTSRYRQIEERYREKGMLQQPAKGGGRTTERPWRAKERFPPD
jgi:hypothetical protein